MRLLTVLVALSLLAGCVGRDGETPLAGPTPAAPEPPGPLDDFTVTPSGEEAAEAQAAARGHAHDLWKGSSRLTLADTDARAREVEHALDVAGGTRHVAIPFLPGALVPEGAALLEITLSEPRRMACPVPLTVNGVRACTLPVPDPAGGSEGLVLRYRHAASGGEWVEAGPIGWGVPVSVPIASAAEVDMPHARATLWQVEVVSPNHEDGTLLLHARIDALRGDGEIPLWPGHPDLYPDGIHAREVLRAHVESARTPVALEAPETASPVSPIDSDTRSLLVFVNVTALDGPAPPTHWYLGWVDANGTENDTSRQLAPHPVSQREHAWVLSVDPDGADSPYAPASRWTFLLEGALYAQTPGDDEGFVCVGNCAEYRVAYDLTILASDLPPEAFTSGAPPAW